MRDLVLITLLALGALGCADRTPEAIATVLEKTIYDADDRVEYYQVPDPRVRALVANSVVVIVPRANVEMAADGPIVHAGTAGELYSLCPGEPFADQPAPVLCTGVLLDWDLVLTADHCVRVLALKDLAVVFGYYYVAPGELLRISRADVVDIAAIVAEESGDLATEQRVDYAWLRISRRVEAPRSPAAVYVEPPPLQVDEPILTAGCALAGPVKVDAGGRVRDLRPAALDYFIADTDTFRGSSGSGAFDSDLSLLGVLTRGGVDFVASDQGCNVELSAANGALAADEQYSYAHRAVQGLCQTANHASSLCRAGCGSPCMALPPPPPALTPNGGCAVPAPPHVPPQGGSAWLLALALGATTYRLPVPPNGRECRSPDSAGTPMLRSILWAVCGSVRRAPCQRHPAEGRS